MRAVITCLAIVLSYALCLRPACSAAFDWAVQFGSDGHDRAVDIAVDGNGNVYITGVTTDLTWPISNDVYVSKYSASGQLLWQEQIGEPSENESTFGLFVDDAGVLVDIVTFGDRHTIQHYAPNGELQSTKPLGSLPPTFQQDAGWDSNRNFLLAGFGNDGAFVSKYSSTGDFQWIRTLDTVQFDFVASVAADNSGNVFIAGDTAGNLGGQNSGETDSFVGKYNTQGTLQWVVQAGSTKREWASEVATDIFGNVYLAGTTEGNLSGQSAGNVDAFVCKYGPNGDFLWSCQIGSSEADEANGLAVDDWGNVFITGLTQGNLAAPATGWDAIFVSKIDASGSLIWTQQIEALGGHFGTAIDVDALGNLFVGGDSQYGSLTSVDPGESDAFIARVNNLVPEPSALMVGAVGILLPSCVARHRTARNSRM